jgi:DNA-binding transcriptional ArsR family regulator
MPPAPDRDHGPSFDHRMVKALDHPVRADFLRVLADRDTLTPAEALKAMNNEGISLSNVAYHARVLNQFDLVEPAGEATHEGVAFRATPAGVLALAAIGLPPRED